MLAQVRKVRFGRRPTRRRITEVCRVRFDHNQVCKRLVEVLIVRFVHYPAGRGLWKFVESVLTTAKRIHNSGVNVQPISAHREGMRNASWLAKRSTAVVSYCAIGCRDRHGERPGLGFSSKPEEARGGFML